jgi:protocatechuate 3,4-dioxygenase beta subunit
MADAPHDHDRGLAFDVSRLLARRNALKVLAGAGFVALVGCGSDSDPSATATTTGGTSSSSSSSSSSSTSTTAATGSSATCSTIPTETAGPFPGDGSNGPNVLTESGIVRSDITSSFGSSTTVASGVPLTVELTIVDADGCAPMPGAAVYAWHCDQEGRYSIYSDGVTEENYLRGVQEAAADGRVTFTTIFPGAYSGRWPHIHFEVYASLDDATSAASPVATSQLALPKDACDLVYATDGYGQSVDNLARTSLQSDMVFGDDGAVHQLAAMSGTVDAGLTAALDIGV